MDDITLLVAAGMGCLTAYGLVRMYLSTKYQMFKSKQISARRTRQPTSAQQGEVGEWLLDILDKYGIDEDMLYSDEMPDELASVMPLVEGFVKGGGLQKILGGGAQPSIEPSE